MFQISPFIVIVLIQLFFLPLPSAFAQEQGTDVAQIQPADKSRPADTLKAKEEQAADGKPKTVHRSEDELLLLEIKLNNLILSEAMPGYLNGSSLLLPLGEFSESLELAIGVDPAAGTAGGWFLGEDRLFYLNVLRANVVVEGRKSTFDSALVEVHSDDIYVDVRLLSKWFPIDIKSDISNMLVGIQSREPLPIEQKISREDYRQRAFSELNGQKTSYPYHESSPKLIGWPIINVNAEATNNRPRTGENTYSTQYHITSTADLGYMNAELFASGIGRQKVNDTRLKFDRKNPNGEIFGSRFGSWPVTEFSFGDIYSPNIALMSQSQLGRGLSLSNYPLNTTSEFDRITLNGDLPLGWDVELYRNEVLIGYFGSNSDGLYEFTEVPLLFGVNVLKLIFYGPQGQIKEEIKTYRVGGELVRPGDIQYRMTASQHDRRFLYRETAKKTDIDGRKRLFLEGRGGLTSSLSVGANVAVIPMEEGQQRYGGLSASTSLGNILTRGDIVKQNGNGWSAGLSGQTSLGGISIILQHDLYRNFFSEKVANATDPLSSQSEIRIDGVVPETVIPQIPFSFTLGQDRNESGDKESSLSNRLSIAAGRASLTNNLTATLNDPVEDGGSRQINGTVLVGGRISDFRIRGSSAYDISPVKKINSMSLSGDWAINREYQGQGSITRTLGTTTTMSYSLGVNTSFEKFLAGFSLDYSDTREVIGRVSFSFSLARDPNQGSLIMKRDNIATKGALATRVFLDNDSNGTFSDGDEPLEGIKFSADGIPFEEATDAEGYAMLTGLETYRPVEVQVDRASITDPYWISDPEGMHFVPRPGTTEMYEFPVVSTGEIDGTVYRVWSEGPGGAAGVIMQLQRPDGSVYRELKTAYDGFYLFDFVPPGDYILRVSQDQLSTLKLKADKVYDIKIEGDGTIVSGMNVVLR